MTADVIVVGAGPAGGEAALAAAATGATVVLLDSATEAGGQVYRAAARELAGGALVDASAHALGDRLRDRLRASRVHAMWEQIVWHAGPGFTVETVGPDGQQTIHGDSLIVAAGTFERVVPVPGWTLPGVTGLGAITVLLKGQRVLPGERTVVAGCGPLLFAAAVDILESGGHVAAVVDLNSALDVAPLGVKLAARPDLVMQGLRWMRRLRHHAVPIFHRHAVVAINGEDSATSAEIAPVDRDWRPVPLGRRALIEGDAVGLGHGLVPSLEITRLLGARHRFDAAGGSWVPEHDSVGRTTIDRLYVAGDVCGIAGAAAAHERGRFAGLAAARDLGKIDDATLAAEVYGARRRVRCAERFGSAAAALMRPRSGLIDLVTPDTIVCRCEDVTRAEIDAAIADGAVSLNAVKAATRCGMGPCQGRMCGETAALLLGRHVGGRNAAGWWTVRPPIRPVLLDQLTGEFEYDDIRPQPLPL